MAEYRQNASYGFISKKPWVPATVEIEEDGGGHSNKYSLPYGLCKKYGIDLPDGARPREAWEALKKHGVYPPYSEEGEDQYDEETGEHKGEEKANGEEKKEKQERKEREKSVSIKIRGKARSGIDDEYIKNVEKSLSGMSDEEFEIFEKTIDSLGSITEGSGKFSPLGRKLIVPKNKADPLNAELGYEFNAVTFFHEYGHFVANCLFEKDKEKYKNAAFERDAFANDEISKVVAEDVLDFINKSSAEVGVKQLESMDRLPRDAVQATLKKLQNLTSVELALEFEPVKPAEFNYDDFFKRGYQYYFDRGFSAEVAKTKAKNFADQQQKRHKQEVETYNKLIEKYNKHTEEERKTAKADLRRFGFLTDSIKIATKARIGSDDYYCHDDSYSKTMPNGVEAWAEYFSIKMTKDKKGEKAFRKYMPKTYETFENIYNNLGDLL